MWCAGDWEDVLWPQKSPACSPVAGRADPEPTSRYDAIEMHPLRPRRPWPYCRERVVRPATTRYAAVSTTRATRKSATWRAASVLASTRATSTYIPVTAQPCQDVGRTPQPMRLLPNHPGGIVLPSMLAARSGRGPTRLMSPLSTLMNWGSSSRENLRRNRPTRVRSASLRSAAPAAGEGVVHRIDRLSGLIHECRRDACLLY